MSQITSFGSLSETDIKKLLLCCPGHQASWDKGLLLFPARGTSLNPTSHETSSFFHNIQELQWSQDAGQLAFLAKSYKQLISKPKLLAAK